MALIWFQLPYKEQSIEDRYALVCWCCCYCCHSLLNLGEVLNLIIKENVLRIYWFRQLYLCFLFWQLFFCVVYWNFTSLFSSLMSCEYVALYFWWIIIVINFSLTVWFSLRLFSVIHLLFLANFQFLMKELSWGKNELLVITDCLPTI